MAHFADLLDRKAEAAQWEQRAATRRDAINKYLWNPITGMFYDYDFTTNRPSTYNYITAFYPLWAGLATTQQATALEHHLSLFEHDGGLAMSDSASGTQWDLPFGWAPTNWLATKGLAQYGFTSDASRVAKEFSQTVLQNFLHDGTIREKYNVVNGSANIEVAAGYKSNVVGFGWTNGVYLELNDLLTHARKDTASIPSQNSSHTELDPAKD
jgi:alpha,alpha-trehalase